MAKEEIGRNVQVEVKDNKLHIVIDLSATGELSGSKKNMVIASTLGNQPIPMANGTLGVNFYRKA